MKRKGFSNLPVSVPALGLAFAGCNKGASDSEEMESGKLTITGLESINGKYIFVGSSLLE